MESNMEDNMESNMESMSIWRVIWRVIWREHVEQAYAIWRAKRPIRRGSPGTMVPTDPSWPMPVPPTPLDGRESGGVGAWVSGVLISLSSPAGW